jgi:hypothetical protein
MLDGRNKYSRYSENGSRVDSAWIEHARVESIQNRRLGMTFNHLNNSQSVLATSSYLKDIPLNLQD